MASHFWFACEGNRYSKMAANVKKCTHLITFTYWITFLVSWQVPGVKTMNFRNKQVHMAPARKPGIYNEFEKFLNYKCNSVCKSYQMCAFLNICSHFCVSITFTCKPEMWRHQLFNASWRAKYWFLGISVYIENVHLLMFFRTN